MLEGGCQVPIGANARLLDGELVLDAFVGSLDGIACLRDRQKGSPDEAEAIGQMHAEAMMRMGANDLLSQARSDSDNSKSEVI